MRRELFQRAPSCRHCSNPVGPGEIHQAQLERFLQAVERAPGAFRIFIERLRPQECEDTASETIELELPDEVEAPDANLSQQCRLLR